jgi:hypothetical protein
VKVVTAFYFAILLIVPHIIRIVIVN